MTRIRVRVQGVVQGVGYRPFVYGLACRLRLGGFVGNDGLGVLIEAEGEPAALDRLVDALTGQAPPLARVEQVEVEPISALGQRDFSISASGTGGPRTVLVAPDTGTCADCLAEMADPADRRHAYAFTNCTNCGPRFTIVRELPYDRPGTTMAAFALCERCDREYADPADRRFHAQPVCCPDCGPRLELRAADGSAIPGDGDPIARAAGLLADGSIVAIKGLGGYHLAVAAANEDAVRTLRHRKHREERPLALMVADLDAARRLCEVDAVEEGLLLDPARPIVVLERRPDAEDAAGTAGAVAPSVAPRQRNLGIMLPYTPLHHLLVSAHPAPLVMTSGNLSDEPIAHRDDDAFKRLSGVADAFLTHDRAIHTRVDDSVLQAGRGGPLPIRRSRGFAPAPLTLPWEFPRHVLACGPELKNTFCLARDRHAFVSHHIGDLENHETLQSFTEGIEHFSRLFSVTPQVVVHDLHPEYLSTKYALDYPDVELVAVQHHHAHIASCLADNDAGADETVIGVAFDGLGMGEDGTLWGGEFLVADLAGFTRAGHLATVPMPGGARAVREPWRMGAAYLDAAYGTDWPDIAPVRDLMARHGERLEQVAAAARAGLNAPRTSSAGRLFDAAAALAGVRDTVSYEGQAAIEFEQLADRSERGCYVARVEAGATGTPLVVHGADLVDAVAADVHAGIAIPVVSARFHNGLAATVTEVCELIRRGTGLDTALDTVALSGGVFQNAILVERCVAGLEAAGFRVLTHRRVPPNDGGISLGQAAVCGARDRRS
ncbi:hydrogenase maturation protein HypF [Catenulispora sp. MAP5-51]|uniref:carbamoyltransferase HypF n=1 Tax=Catenulispora sp. MAP5-51 TaxID=3156298 RepID=UPI00351524F1